jgi:hypothetical protein
VPARRSDRLRKIQMPSTEARRHRWSGSRARPSGRSRVVDRADSAAFLTGETPQSSKAVLAGRNLSPSGSGNAAARLVLCARIEPPISTASSGRVSATNTDDPRSRKAASTLLSVMHRSFTPRASWTRTASAPRGASGSAHSCSVHRGRSQVQPARVTVTRPITTARSRNANAHPGLAALHPDQRRHGNARRGPHALGFRRLTRAMARSPNVCKACVTAGGSEAEPPVASA